MVQQQYGEIDQNIDWQGLARQRSQIYWFVSEFFLKQPDTIFLHHLKNRLHDFYGLENSGLQVLQETLAEIEPSDTLAQKLAIEYTRLFHGLQQGYGPPPPYESLYRQGQPGEVTTAVYQFYLTAGYDLTAECTGPQDHLGVELKFMALLCHDEAEACAKQDWQTVIKLRQFQKRFLKKHIVVWACDYCHRLNEATHDKFYQAVGSITIEALEKDQQVLKEMMLQSQV